MRSKPNLLAYYHRMLAAEELSPFKLGQIQQLIADVNKDAGNARVESFWFLVWGLGSLVSKSSRAAHRRRQEGTGQ
jgi:hypothetical protein